MTIVGDPPGNSNDPYAWLAGTPFEGDRGTVTCTGRVDRLEPLLDSARVFVSPSLKSTGVKTKNVLALESGVPLVTTTSGAEGLSLPPSLLANVADEPHPFAAAVRRLYTQPHVWEEAAILGRGHIALTNGKAVLAAAVKSSLETLAATPRQAAPMEFDGVCMLDPLKQDAAVGVDSRQ